MKRQANRWLTVDLLLILGVAATCGAADSIFDLDEIVVVAAPDEPRTLAFAAAETPLDFDVAPFGPEVAVVVKGATGDFKILFWDINSPDVPKAWQVPGAFQPRYIAWHPAKRTFFLAGQGGRQFLILRVDENAQGWEPKTLYKSDREIRRLVPAPRPFEPLLYGEDLKRTERFYRVFFGLKSGDGTYVTKSVNERGEREYQAIGPKEGIARFPDGELASDLRARSALPLAFHPAGHLMLWEDENNCFHVAGYDREHWAGTRPLLDGQLCGGTVTPTANGLGLIHWQKGRRGVAILLDRGKKRSLQAAEYDFVSTPSSVPDGKGIVGLTKTKQGFALNYVPIEIPLADVVNAWMFLASPEDLDLVGQHGGLFRELDEDAQLYSLYESEAYACDGQTLTVPTRPYFVTTDIFWEIFAAAYQGMFIVRERREAVPAFWEFVRAARQALRATHPKSPWTRVFSAVAALRDSDGGEDREAARILRAQGREFSPVLGTDFDYSELKPRGHYTSTPALQTYFKAFRYLTEASAKLKSVDELGTLPPKVKDKALDWVRPYESFIAPSRAPLVWSETGFSPPSFAHHPETEPRIFPLGWGFDNEILLSTVFHLDWAEAEQIKGPEDNKRLLPSGLDVAAALGSDLARALLQGEVNKYPPLARALEGLRARYAEIRSAQGKSENLYDRWMAALATQWADDDSAACGGGDERLWRVKRLQTGLASWATLRHATVLVNERTAAECGEGGFEAVLLRPPRGSVEPDPRTFEAIAGLFDAAAAQLEPAAGPFRGELPREWGEKPEPLHHGILKRLRESARKARVFRDIAEKERRGESLAKGDYEEILYVGRVAEHHFLVFKSLANKELALSNPDPVPKIADVAGGGPYQVPYLMVAVGRPLEWDHIVPFFGRRQIVKGSVYSYNEFGSEALLSDEEWRERLAAQPRPSWVAPFFSKERLPCPARDPY